MANLQILNGSQAGESFPISGDQTVIGRYPFCDIVLDDHTVSREHVRISRTEDAFYVEDLGSLNGTFVNGQRISGRTRLKDKDRIQIYKVLAKFFQDQPSAAVAAEGTESEKASDGAVAEVPEDAHQARIVDSLDATSDSRLGVNPEQKLQAILDMIRNLGSSLATDEVLEHVLEGLFDIFPQASQAYIQLPDRFSGKLVPCAMRNRRNDAGGITFAPISRDIADRVMQDGKAVLTSDAVMPTDDEDHSVLEADVRCMMCAPLIGPGRKTLGIIHIDTDDAVRPFSQDDLEVLVSVAAIAGQIVQFASVHESALRLDRRDRELLTAREVQRHFLPSGRPEIPGYEFYDYYVPADEIGGDYFGYIALPEDRLAIAMGDVAGKGVSAALLMARLCSEVPYRLVMSPSPAEAMQRLNLELFGPDFECPFVTFVLCVLDPVAHTLTFANAGHLPPLWRHASSRAVEELGLEQGGLPLGVEQQPNYRAQTIQLDPGDIVVMYTDGISEAVNAQGTLYGSGRVRDVVTTGPLEPAALGRVIIQKLKQFQEDAPQTDDTCLLCFARDSSHAVQ